MMQSKSHVTSVRLITEFICHLTSSVIHSEVLPQSYIIQCPKLLASINLCPNAYEIQGL